MQDGRDLRTEFAAPVFGIKAKLKEAADVIGKQFAAPVFGIKAKRCQHHFKVAVEFAAPVLESRQSNSVVRLPSK